MKLQHPYNSLSIIILVGVLIPGMVCVFSPSGTPGTSIQAFRSNVTCSNPTTVSAANCRQIEELILRSTVRIQIETWIVRPDESGYDIDISIGHATLKDGRYLVTHNHFNVPLSIRPGEVESEVYGVMTVFNCQGESRFRGPLSDFELVWTDPETLIIAHQENDFFENLGFVSAEFKAWPSVPLKAGMEVAQVDWDGSTTQVDWVTVKEVNLKDDIQWLVLNGDVMTGASGGGVFWQGAHIANNWLLVQYLDESGTLVNANTKVVLNSAEVAGSPYKIPVLAGAG